MIYLIGVYHQIQYLRDDDKDPYIREEVRKFRKNLIEEINQKGIKLLAEEFSTEVCQINQVEKSAAQIVSEKVAIEHRFCDPDKEQRALRKIKCGDPDSIDKRRSYWLDCILDCIDIPTIFICGDNHVEGFKSKLEDAGFTVEVLGRNWGKKINNSGG